MFKTSTKKSNFPRHSAWRMVRWATASLICFNLTSALLADQRSPKSVEDLLAQGEISVGSLLPEQTSLLGNVPKVLPKVLKWQQSRSKLREVPNSNGILVRVEVNATAQDSFETPASVRQKPEMGLPSSPAMQGELETYTASAYRTQDDFAALIPSSQRGFAEKTHPQEDSDALSLEIGIDFTHVSIRPKRLVMKRIGQEAKLRVDSLAGVETGEVNVFVRDQAVVLWNPEHRSLKSLASGATELYIVVDGQMHVVPVQVEVDESVISPLTVASSLLSLKNVFGEGGTGRKVAALSIKDNDGSALSSHSDALPVHTVNLVNDEASNQIVVRAFKSNTKTAEIPAGPASRSALEPLAAVIHESGSDSQATGRSTKETLQTPASIQVFAYKHNERIEAKISSRKISESKHSVSLSSSEAEAANTLKRAGQLPAWTRELADSKLKTVTFQVVDERSELSKGVVYPSTHAIVKVLGTEFKAQTNASGNVTLSDVPGASRLVVSIDDPRGAVRPTVTEVNVDEIADYGVIRLPVLSYKSFDFYQNVARITQRADRASLCVRLSMNSSQRNLSGFQLKLNRESEGPLYFNAETPSPEQFETGVDGRACFFNVEPGLVELSIEEGGETAGASVLSLLAGRHQEEDLSLYDGPSIATRLVSVSTVKDQVFGDKFRAHQVRPVDSADLLFVGVNDPFIYDQPGRMHIPAGKTFWNSRAYSYVNSSEFEPTMYSLNREDAKSRHVTQLFPRGYIEELFQELYVENDDVAGNLDPEMGSLVIHHGNMEGQGGKGVNIKVLNHSGYEVDSGWYYGNDAEYVTKAVYFNLPSGLYNIIITAEDNSWLASDTTIVDHGVMTFVETGAKLTYQRSLRAEEVEASLVEVDGDEADSALLNEEEGGKKPNFIPNKFQDETMESAESEESIVGAQRAADEVAPEMENLSQPDIDSAISAHQQEYASKQRDIGVTFESEEQISEESNSEGDDHAVKTTVTQTIDSEVDLEYQENSDSQSQSDLKSSLEEPNEEDETGIVFDVGS